MSINRLDYVVERMKTIKPRYDELGLAPTLTDEERAEYDRSKKEWDDLEVERADLVERQARAAAAAAVPFSVIKDKNAFDVSELRGADRGQVIERGRRAVGEMSHRFARPEHAEAARHTIERGGRVGELAARLAVTTGSDEYSSEWIKYMSGRAANLQVLERANDEYRAFTAGTGNSGGYMVPLYMDPTFVITGAGSYNPFRQVSNVKQITTLIYNGSTAAQVTAARLGEGSAFSDNAPVIGQVQISTVKAGAYLPASFEAFEDIDSLAQDAGMLLADAKDNLEASWFATGSGSDPEGVVTGVTAITASRVNPASGGAYAVADVYSLHSGLPARFRRTASGSRAWVANVGIIDKTRQFATANNYHAFLTDMTTDAPSRLLGDQLIESSEMSASVTTGQNVLLFGDFSRYYIVDRVGLQTEFIPNVVDSSGLPTGQRAWLAHWRVGAKVADPNAFRILKL